jgi:hypothetical protein
MLKSSDGRPSDFQINCSLSVLKNLTKYRYICTNYTFRYKAVAHNINSQSLRSRSILEIPSLEYNFHDLCKCWTSKVGRLLSGLYSKRTPHSLPKLRCLYLKVILCSSTWPEKTLDATCYIYRRNSKLPTPVSFIQRRSISCRTSSGAEDMYVMNPAASSVFNGNSLSSFFSSPTYQSKNCQS